MPIMGCICFNQTIKMLVCRAVWFSFLAYI